VGWSEEGLCEGGGREMRGEILFRWLYVVCPCDYYNMLIWGLILQCYFLYSVDYGR